MKIQHVIVGLDVGGAEMMLKRLIESHSGDPRYEHSVVSLTTFGRLGPQLQAQGINVSALGMRSPLGALGALFRLHRVIRAASPDVVQTWMYHADLMGGLAARTAGFRNVVWGIHSTDVRAGGSRGTTLVMQLCARLSRWVPRVILCVAEVSRRAHISYGYDAARMLVVPNGLDLSNLTATQQQRAEFRAHCGFGEDDFVIGTLGRFNPAKDYENFVSAAGILAAKNAKVRFLMIGRNLDSNNPVLAKWIAATGYADRFVLLGERTDAPVCLAAMDTFCLSSRSEALPTVVAEAMAMAVPCVATDVGDTAGLVGDTGLIVPKEDPDCLASALLRMADTPFLQRTALGQRAKLRIHAEYTIERAKVRFESIYHKIVENKES